MKHNNLRSRTMSELNQEHQKLLQELFKLRTQKAIGQLIQKHNIKIVKRSIARILTIAAEDRTIK